MNNEIYNAFSEWLDNILENDMPDNTKAYNFNIYDELDEDGNDAETYGIQLIASDEFSEDDDDWACSEIYSSQEDIFYIDHSDEDNIDSDSGLEFICSLIREYLNNGKYSDKLSKAQAVGAGFVDGDIKIIFSKNK